MEDTIWGKITYDGRQPSIEGNLPWKTAFNRKKPSKEENFSLAAPGHSLTACNAHKIQNGR